MLRQRDNPEPILYPEAANEYSQTSMKRTEKPPVALYREIIDRNQEEDQPLSAGNGGTSLMTSI